MDWKFCANAVFFGMRRDRFTQYQPQRNLEEKIALVASVEEVTGIELKYPADFGDAGQVRGLLEAHGLRLAAVNVDIKDAAYFRYGALSARSPEARRKAVGLLREGMDVAAEAISTFRTAADLCEEFDGFVFNHNEVVLYEWVEEYEPELFRRIQKLVKAGKWHVMGGWFLQPDCNMPSGESFVRQVLYGRRYFSEKFGVAPTTAINLDPFGHTRGLAQILARSGFDAYLFCRPGQGDCALERDYFVWVGFDGSEVMACRAPMHYNAPLGKAREKVEQYLERYPDTEPGIVLWGVGNHGGGPSREDIQRLDEMITGDEERRIRHARPEDFFACLEKQREDLPRREQDINPWAVGCYTSQVRLKQKHRRLENELFMVEKMASAAALSGKMEYPRKELREAMRDLLFAEFHDILPGSSIQPVEDTSLRLMDHGLEILSRMKARTFFSLASGEPKAKEGEIPVLVYNPHPHRVRTTVECEFQLADIGWERSRSGR